MRAVVWRGSGEDMGVASAKNPVRMAIAIWGWGAYYGDAKMKGAKLDIAEYKRPSPETIPVHAKAAGLYMICTISKHKAEAKGCSDALFLDWRGYVAEATGANIFFVKDGEVHTPLADCFLNGITRQTVIQMLKDKGITVHERRIEPEEMEGFEQCWLTGTAAEVTPVGEIGPYSFEVGDLTRSNRRRLRGIGAQLSASHSPQTAKRGPIGPRFFFWLKILRSARQRLAPPLAIRRSRW